MSSLEHHSRLKKFLITSSVILILGGGSYYGYKSWSQTEKPLYNYETSPATIQDFQVTIEATGTLEPEELIDVGARVSGEILEFGTDNQGKEVDYGSYVKKGQLLARIDDVVIKSEEKKAQASVSQAKANIAVAEADLISAQATYNEAQRNLERAKKLGPSDALSQMAYDKYLTAAETSAASIKQKEASIEQAQANLTQAQATLEAQQRNVSYTTINSPVDGVIINRIVNKGQTVNAGMNTPSLFLVAKDLSKMQIWAAVNEADIGNIKPGQDVLFSVDAFPKQEFHGTVDKIRLNATMSSNVVTYIVEINAPNPDKILLPYLTTTTKFIIKNYKDSLVVPNTALRWTPSPDMIPLESQYDTTEGDYVWIKEGENIRPIPVTIKDDNGTLSVVESKELKPEDNLIIESTLTNGETPDIKEPETEETASPFAPKFPKHNRQKTATKRAQNDGPPPAP